MPENTHDFVFGGFGLPRYTTVPDEVFDILMARLSGAELKVLLYIIRRTCGFKKDADTISVSQMCNGIRRADGSVLDNGTGLSRQSVITAVKALEAMAVIVARRNSSAARGDEATTYSLRFESAEGGESTIPTRTGQTIGQGRVKKDDNTGSKNMAGGIQNHDPQQPVYQQTEQQNSLSNDSTGKTSTTENSGINPNQIVPEEPVSKQYDISPSLSPTLDACVADYSREMGDNMHIRVNIARARRLWHTSGLDETVFCEWLRTARQKTRDRQMAGGGVRNRAAYFFAVLEQDLAPQPVAATLQSAPPITELAPSSVPAWWQAYEKRYESTG